MFVLKKLITPFLMPLGILVVLFVGSGILLLRRNFRKIGAFQLILGLMTWILSTAPLANELAGSLEAQFQIPDYRQGDVIILLGGGIVDNVPDISGIGQPGDNALARLVTAVRLQKRLGVPIIVSGGKGYENIGAEAPILKRFLLDLGVSQKMVIIEDRSKDTRENARYSKEICDRHGFIHPVVVTSAIHLRRSVMNFKNVGLDVIAFPAPYAVMPNRPYFWRDFLPSAANLFIATAALHEYLGIVYEKLLS
jgi:uncharacterized SAM-binding protein YcdF (DUF218 family)